MYEQDYIMRLIKELIRSLLKLLFHIDMDSPITELVDETVEKEKLESYMDLVDEGHINEAENHIYEITSNGDMKGLEMALLFYSYLNDKTDKFLLENNFSREEIKYGLKRITSKYGLGNLAEIILRDL